VNRHKESLALADPSWGALLPSRYLSSNWDFVAAPLATDSQEQPDANLRGCKLEPQPHVLRASTFEAVHYYPGAGSRDLTYRRA
jgi:hypothetical protein